MMLASKFKNLVCAEDLSALFPQPTTSQRGDEPQGKREAREAFLMSGRLLKYLKYNQKARMRSEFI